MTTINTFFFTNSSIIDIAPTNTEGTPLFEGTYLLHLDGRPILTKLEEPELYKVGDTSPNRMVLRKNKTTGYSCILTMEQWEYIRDRKGEVRDHTLQEIIDGIPTREALQKHAHNGVSEHQLFEVQMLRTAKYAMATLIRDKPHLVTRERIAQIADKCPFLDPEGAEYIELVHHGMNLARIFAVEGMPPSNSGIRGKSGVASRPADKPIYDDMEWAVKLVMDTKSIADVSTDTDIALGYLRTKMKETLSPGSRATHTYNHLVETIKGLSTPEALRCIAAVLAEVTGKPVVDITIGSEMESSGMRWITLKYVESAEDTPSLKVNSADPDLVRAAFKDIELSNEALADRQVTLATLSKAIDTYISIGQDIDISYQDLLHGDTLPDGEFYPTVAKLYSAMVGLDIEDFIKGNVKDTSK